MMKFNDYLARVLRFLPGPIGFRYQRRYYRSLTANAHELFVASIRHLRPGCLALDVGANKGKYTQLLAATGCRVIAFEPDPVAFGILEQNLRGFDNVVLINAAVSTTAGTATMYRRADFERDPAGYSEGTSLHADKSNLGTDNSITVRTVNLVQWLNELDAQVDLLKMDIEGEEVPMLEQFIAAGCLDRIGQMFVETHEFKIPSLYARTMGLRRRLAGRKNINLNWG